jgi:hypothetical protein
MQLTASAGVATQIELLLMGALVRPMCGIAMRARTTGICAGARTSAERRKYSR